MKYKINDRILILNDNIKKIDFNTLMKFRIQ